MVGPEVLVRLQYWLWDAEGRLVEACPQGEPVEWVVGFGQAPAPLELALEGLLPGGRCSVKLPPGEAFGPRDADRLLWLEREELPAELAVGADLEAESDAGRTVFMRVLEIHDDAVLVDCNHPLAGQTIRLELEVVSARPATAAECAAAEASFDEQCESQAAGPGLPLEPREGQFLPASALLAGRTLGGFTRQ